MNEIASLNKHPIIHGGIDLNDHMLTLVDRKRNKEEPILYVLYPIQ